VEISISKPSENIHQLAYLVHDTQKERLLEILMAEREVNSCIIFCSTKTSVRSVNRRLQKKGWSSAAISSDLEQAEREEVLTAFRNRKLIFLVATDVMSRGIDIDNIEIVVNYEVPKDAEDYVHRIGRTARAGASGLAITFINEDDVRRFMAIERLIERTIEKPTLPTEMGEGPAYERAPKGHRPPKHGQRPHGQAKSEGGKKPFKKKWRKKPKGQQGQGDEKPKAQ
jgi:superfamily II DNA/RNA helicase